MNATSASQTDVVVEAVRELIRRGELLPGDRLPVEKELADQLQVSRGSLREGIRALAALGLVETRQGAGTFVTDLDPSRLLDAVAFWVSLQAGPQAVHAHVVRRALEVQSAELAAVAFTPADDAAAAAALERARRSIEADPPDHHGALEADLEFHRVIAASTGNPVLEALVEVMAAPTMRGRLWRSLHDESRLGETHRQHQAILTALRRHDPVQAGVQMRAHLYTSEQQLPAEG